MPLLITKRPADLGRQLTIQPKVVKDDLFARFAIPLSTTVSEVEVKEMLLSSPLAKALYKHLKDREPEIASPVVPYIPLIPFDSANVTLYLGRAQLKLVDVRVTANRIVLQNGGISGWTFKVQCLPNLDDHIKQLLSKIGQNIQIELECDTYGAQPMLPLEEAAASAAEHEEDDNEDAEDKDPPETVSSIEDRISRSEQRRRRTNA